MCVYIYIYIYIVYIYMYIAYIYIPIYIYICVCVCITCGLTLCNTSREALSRCTGEQSRGAGKRRSRLTPGVRG